MDIFSKKVALAHIAEQAERYEEMKENIKYVATNPREGETTVHLSLEERNLLSVAYKNIVGSKRNAWRSLHFMEEKARAKQENEELLAELSRFRETIERELIEVCSEIVTLIQDYLIHEEDSVDERVYYYKMVGDYYRYECEILTGEDRNEVITKADESYKKALEIAREGCISNVNPILLGLCLNYSVFYYEIKEDTKYACELASETFNKALEVLDSIPEDEYKDSTLILQLLRDNLTLWSPETTESHN